MRRPQLDYVRQHGRKCSPHVASSAEFPHFRNRDRQIFKYQPSPFCVMDDVDAPLDEANIGRLTRLITDVGRDAVRSDHALQAHHGSGAGAVRRDHAGARSFAAGFGEAQGE